MENIQRLELVNRLFPDLLSGKKKNTLRWQEGDIKHGYLEFYSSNIEDLKALVWVTNVTSAPMSELAYHYDMSAEELHESMKTHYGDIKIDSDVSYIEYLSPEETALKHP